MATLIELIEGATQDQTSRNSLISEFAIYPNIDFKNTVSQSDLDTFLLHAAEVGHISSVTLLLSQGVNIEVADDSGKTPFILAAKYQHLEILQLLLDNRANIDATEPDGTTALITAVSDSSEKTVKFLLERGANPNGTAESDRETSLWVSVDFFNLTIFEMLLQYGANVAAKTSGGTTPLHYAARHGYGKHVNFLLDFGANIESSNDAGETPLHTATYVHPPLPSAAIYSPHQDERIIASLILNGANIAAKRNNGNTPIDLVYFADTHKEVNEALSLRATLNKCILFIPTPYYHDSENPNKPPPYYKLPMDVILKIAVELLQSKLNSSSLKLDYDPESLILKMAHKRNMEILKSLMESMLRHILISKYKTNKLKFSDRVPKHEIESIYNKLSPYSSNIYFFTQKQRQIFVKEMARKKLTSKNIEETIGNLEVDRNDGLIEYFESFSKNLEMPIR